MKKITAIYAPYAGWSFKDKDNKTIKDFSNIWFKDSNGIEGKIKCTGIESIYEQGYSGSEDKYSFIDSDLNFRPLINGEEFETDEILSIYKDFDLKIMKQDSSLKVDGFVGTFTYDIEKLK